ncbi:MAG TPA: sugar kinase [Burkholderiaceae bacterium]
MSAGLDGEVVLVGEPLVLFAATEPGPLAAARRFERFSAGAELNVAIGLARLGFRVDYLTRVGDDSFGRFLLDVLDREGVGRAGAIIDPLHSTGFMLKSRAPAGEDPAIEYHRRGSAASRMGIADLPARLGDGVRQLHLTGVCPALSPSCCELVFSLANAAREAGRRISFDPNMRPSLWPDRGAMVATLGRLSALADLVLPGLEEGRLLTGCHSPQEIAAHYLERGAREVVVKLGPEGAYCASRDIPGQFVAGRPVKDVVDTVGAGDAFATGVISALLEGLPLAEATARGNLLGARAVRFPGDCDGLPTRAQLDEEIEAQDVPR